MTTMDRPEEGYMSKRELYIWKSRENFSCTYCSHTSHQSRGNIAILSMYLWFSSQSLSHFIRSYWGFLLVIRWRISWFSWVTLSSSRIRFSRFKLQGKIIGQIHILVSISIQSPCSFACYECTFACYDCKITVMEGKYRSCNLITVQDNIIFFTECALFDVNISVWSPYLL